MSKDGDQVNAGKDLVRAHEAGEDWSGFDIHLASPTLTVALLDNPSERLLQAFRNAGWAEGGQVGS